MTTVAQVAQAMQTLLTTTADQAARSTGFVQRRSKLTGATFAQTLVFGWLAQPDASLEALAQTAATRHIAITPQGLEQRFTAQAAAMLAQVLATAVQQVIASDPVAVPLLQRFTGVYLQDSSTIVLPDALAAIWPGCGGSSPVGTSAALKLHVRWDVTRGTLAALELQPGCAHDGMAALQRAPLPPGAIRLADLGYWSLEVLRELDAQHSYWLSRLKVQTTVFDAAGQRWDLATLLAAQGTTEVDLPITLGVDHRLPARLLARHVPPAVANAWRRKLKVAARRKGQAVSATRLALADWTIFVTNVPAAQLTLAEALVLARVRWQLELLFKLWKSHGHIDVSRSRKPWRILCEVYAKLLAMVVQHWLLLIGCWHYPDRSLTKAAQTIRKDALQLASEFDAAGHLQRAITTIQRCLAWGCRINKRKTQPHTYQLLLMVTDECLA